MAKRKNKPMVYDDLGYTSITIRRRTKHLLDMFRTSKADTYDKFLTSLLPKKNYARCRRLLDGKLY